jgi:hypothetical protein
MTMVTLVLSVSAVAYAATCEVGEAETLNLQLRDVAIDGEIVSDQLPAGFGVGTSAVIFPNEYELIFEAGDDAVGGVIVCQGEG